MIAIPIGKRWRALQYEPVPMLFALNPSASRRAAQPFTTFWHEPSSFDACIMNIDNATVGGYSRAMLGQVSFGQLQQLRSRQHVEKLHRIGPSARLPMLFRCCRDSNSALRLLKAGLGVVGVDV
jgi:hypothetical protein